MTAIVAYVDEGGPVYVDDATGAYIGRDPGVAAAAPAARVDDYGNAVNQNGSQILINQNSAADIANLRQNYTQLQSMTDQQIRDYLGPGQFQLGSNRTGDKPLTHIVNNASGISQFVSNLKGFLTDGALPPILAAAGGAGAINGLTGGSALANVGAGATEFGGETALQGSSYLTPGSAGALDFAATAPIAPDAPWGVNPYSVPDVPYDVGENLVNNPEMFNPDVPYDAGENLVNNPQTFTPSSGLPKLPPGAQSALSRLINGNATAADYAQIAGALGTTGVGILSANSQANTLKGIYDQQRADRAPSLAAYNTALANPDTFYNSAPAMGSVDAVLRKLSVNGNPAANPGDLSKAAAYNLGGYTNYLGALSGPAFGGQGTQAQLGTGIAGTQASMGNALGGGLTNITTPTQDWSSILSQLGKISLNNGMSLA